MTETEKLILDKLESMSVDLREVKDKTARIEDRVTGIEDKVAVIENRVTGIENKVEGIEDRVTGIENKVAVIEDRVTGIENKVSHAWSSPSKTTFPKKSILSVKATTSSNSVLTRLFSLRRSAKAWNWS